MLGIKSVNTLKTLKFTWNLKPKLKKNLILPSLNHSLATCQLLIAISVLSLNTRHVKLTDAIKSSAQKKNQRKPTNPNIAISLCSATLNAK